MTGDTTEQASRDLISLIVIVSVFLVVRGEALGQEGWRFEADLGPFFKTVDGTVMGLALNADYFATEDLSFGPAVQFLPFGDLTQLQLSAVARYHVRTNFHVNIVPFVGIGLVTAHAQHPRGVRPWRQRHEHPAHEWGHPGIPIEQPVGPGPDRHDQYLLCQRSM